MSKYSSNDESGLNCGCYIFVLIFNLLVGGWSVNYLLLLLGKNIPFFWDTLIGIFTAEISVPVAVVVWILKSLGVF
jgi:hypothetical protein